jgi:hypothetical protein
MLRLILPSLLMLSLACTSEPGSDTGDATTTTGDPTTSGEVCTPGQESCACTDAGVCLEGLACLSNRCVMLPDGSTSGSTEAQESGTTMALDESSTSSSSEDSSTGAAESSSSSSTTATFPECEVSGTYCEAGTATMFTCVQGTWFEHLDCGEACAVDGWATGTCDPELETTCVCDGFGDAACDIGTQAFCTCLPELGAGSCDDDDIENVYLNCFSGSWDYVECFGAYLIDGVIDCNAASAGCL